MTRRRHGLAVALVAVLAALAMTTSHVAAADKALDDLLFDLQLVPLDGQTPPPFELERLGDGKKVTLAEHRGRPVMLYFWATW
jgi:cytochrome oxidase Cu insertion factor (SCO1/SenC/PrrC family)